jgi:hypothetical protein
MRAFFVLLVVGAAFASVPSQAQNTRWDGTWVGFWGRVNASRIVVAGGKVTEYRFRRRSYPTGTTKISGNTLRFGTDRYSIVLVRTEKSKAKATYRIGGKVRGVALFIRR